MSIRVMIVDDHKMFRDGLTSMLARVPDIEVVGEAENGRSATALARKLEPDVVIMDIGMAELNGIEAARQVVAEAPNVRVLALSMHSDRRFVSGMLEAGACGYVMKDSPFEELTRAIRAVAKGERYLSQKIADVVMTDYVRHLKGHGSTTSTPATKELTAREREVLQLIAEGLSTREIASALQLSAKTIETHRAQIMNKVGIRNVAGLVKYAMREGITSLDD